MISFPLEAWNSSLQETRIWKFLYQAHQVSIRRKRHSQKRSISTRPRPLLHLSTSCMQGALKEIGNLFWLVTSELACTHLYQEHKGLRRFFRNPLKQSQTPWLPQTCLPSMMPQRKGSNSPLLHMNIGPCTTFPNRLRIKQMAIWGFQTIDSWHRPSGMNKNLIEILI